jgi:hypothetical protein
MTNNANTNVIAALLTKLELLYGVSNDTNGMGGKNTFLSFQLPAIPLSPRQLSFALPTHESGLTPQEEKTLAADFARLVNLVPAASTIWASDGRALWSEYETVLTQAIVANDDPTVNEAAELQTARDLLDSPKYVAYQQYLKAYMSALEKYNEAKLKAENSSDPVVKQEWQLQEPGYKATLKSAYLEWIAKGYKADIEEAFADIDRIGGRSPQLLWAKWKDDFNQSQRTDLEGQRFYETHFFPRDFFKPTAQGQWTKLTLDASEIAALSSKAPDGIRNLATLSDPANNIQAVDLEIARLSVELVRVPLLRSWLEPGVFSSKLWKWSVGHGPLSDGQSPPSGSLPAYTTSMILARNLEIELKPGSANNARIISQLQTGKLVMLGPLPLRSGPKELSPAAVTRLSTSAISLQQVDRAVVDQVVATKSTTKLGSASLDIITKQRLSINRAAFLADDPATAEAKGLLPIDRSRINLSDQVVARPISSADRIVKPLPAQPIDSRIVDQIRRIPIESPPIVILPKDPKPTPSPAPAPNPTPPPPPTVNDGLQIIAFVCAKLPKSPDPEVNLVW